MFKLALMNCPPGSFTVGEAAEMLGVKECWIRSKILSTKIKTVRVGRKFMFIPLAELEKLKEMRDVSNG